jgi:AraC-like DNA-binding protein
MDQYTEPPRGVLNRKHSENRYQLFRYPSAEDLQFFVECYWVVHWDLRGQSPHQQENLPHPCVHIVASGGQCEIFGVVEKKFSRVLENQGRIFGVKFRPGAFYPFVKRPISEFTNRVVSIASVFDAAGATFGKAILSAENDSRLVTIADEFLRGQQPQRNENIVTVGKVIDRVVSDREIKRVDDLLRVFNVKKRTLQRIFNKYVGVSPKWVIQRYRLHEALAKLEQGTPVNWTILALDLGYSDQAHFINDFKRLVGKSPAKYTRNPERGSP